MELVGLHTPVALQTARLVLRPPRLADAAALFAFLGDAEAMRHTQVRTSVRDCRRYLAVHERQRRRTGCAPWVVLDKEACAVIGFGGLYEDPFDPGWGVELAYSFAPAAWGRGYATELAQFCLELAERDGRWPEICAFARPGNTASRRVLEKVGFATVRYIPEMERYLYRYEVGQRAWT
jgi:[ribosomal protein S5]-alanine N-acetyltransferase